MNAAGPVMRVAVVDDHTIIREGLASHLPHHQVMAAYPHHAPLLANPPEVDVVLLDLHLRAAAGAPARHGAAAVTDLSEAGYTVLIYTNEERRLVLARCLAAGARGIIHKSETLEALAAAITAVGAGEIVITPALTGVAEVIDLPDLTVRQRQVLAGRARGETWRKIAGRLDISEKTAHEHWGEVTRKFAVYLRTHSPADLERHLGLGRGDLLDPTEDPQ